MSCEVGKRMLPHNATTLSLPSPTWGLHPGPSAYSSLVSLDAKTVGCFYENGEKRAYERITFARVELTSGK